jgi:hypothetical protein
LCYSKEENVIFWATVKRHSSYNWKSLLAGSFPVFVAATISAAVVAVIDVITEDDTAEIVLSFFYALGIAQMLGYWVIYNIPSTSPSFRYYYRVATENSAFAWKEFLVLIVLNKLIYGNGLDVAFGVYAGMLVVICVIVVVLNYVHRHYLKAPEAVYLRVKLYESELFALGLAFTLNLLVIAGLCGVNYLGFLGYGESDDQTIIDGYYNQCQTVGFAYPLMLSYLLVKLHQSGLFDEGEEYLERAEQCLGDEEEDELARLSAAVAEEHERGLLYEPLVVETAGAGDSVAPEDTLSANSGVVVAAAATAMDTSEGGSAVVSLSMLLYIYLGVFVGCAWYAWSVSVYGHEYTEVPVVGALIFAVIITFLGHWLIMRSTLRAEAALAKQRGGSRYRIRRGKVIQVALRLVVGWSWEEVTIHVIDLIFEDEHKEAYKWGRAAIKVALALVVLFIGRELELRAGLLRERKLRELRASMSTGYKCVGPGQVQGTSDSSPEIEGRPVR